MIGVLVLSLSPENGEILYPTPLKPSHCRVTSEDAPPSILGQASYQIGELLPLLGLQAGSTIHLTPLKSSACNKYLRGRSSLLKIYAAHCS